MRRVRTLAAVGVVAALAVGSLGTGAANAQSKKKDVPWKFYLLADTRGEASTAIPNYADAADLAASQMSNVSYTRIPAGLTAASAETALTQAAPTADAMVGLTSSTQTTTLGPKIASILAGKPLITLNADPNMVNGVGVGGADNIFLSLPIGDQVARENARFLASQKPKPKKVGLLCVSGPFGETSCNAAKEEFQKLGIEVATTQSNAATATDLTQQVLAFKDAGVDAVQTFTFPNPLAVFVNQMAQNGVNIPINGAQSAPFAVATKSIDPANLARFYGTDYCVPGALKTKVAKKFVKDYTAKFGYAPTSASTQVYDGIGFLNAAINTAKSTDPKKVVAAMDKTSYEGVCGSYTPDSGNGLWHTLSYVGYNADGTAKILDTIEVGSVGKAAGSTVTTTTAAAATTTTAPR